MSDAPRRWYRNEGDHLVDSLAYTGPSQVEPWSERSAPGPEVTPGDGSAVLRALVASCEALLRAGEANTVQLIADLAARQAAGLSK